MALPPSDSTPGRDRGFDLLRALADLGRGLADASAPDAVAARAAESLDQLLRPDHLLIVLRTPAGGRAVAHARDCPAAAPDDPLIDHLLRHGPRVIDRNVRAALGLPPETDGIPASWVGAPFLGAAPLGAVSLGADTPGRYGPDDLRIVEAVAAQTAIALRHTFLMDAVSSGKREWEQTVDAIRQAFCVVDAGGRVRRANRAFGELVEQPLTAVPGQPLIALVPPTWAETVSKLVARPGTGKTCELRARDRIFILSVLPLHDAGEGSAVLVLEDQTDKRRLQDQLVQSEKLSAIGQLIAGVAHDLNNPLASVIGFADYLLEQEETTPPELTEPLRAIQQEAERATNIVRNLLSFARKHEGRRRAVPIGNILEATLLLLRNQLMASKTDADLDVAADLPDVLVDTTQVQQVFVNLINNAAQAIAAGGTGGHITVRAQPWLDGVAVVVEDDGPGIPPETRERIFEPFFTTKPEGEGTGLGLSICQGIIKEHGGRITCTPAPGGGAAFRVEIPGADHPAHETGEMPVMPAGLRILVVDDEPHIRHYLQATLEAWGHQVTLADGGHDALALMADTGPWDVVLSDIRMPAGGGRELYEALRRDQPALARRVIFSTGDTVRGDTLAFLEALDRPWLRKPFTLNELRVALAWATQP